jgi:hypothetical protein
MPDSRELPMPPIGVLDAKVRNPKLARGACFKGGALKQATAAYFKARLEIGSRGKFCGVLRSASLN